MGETNFDKEKEFKEVCQPLLDKLIIACSLHHIPFFWTACVKNGPSGTSYQSGTDETHTKYVNDAAGSVSRGITLHKAQIVKHIAVAGGFDVIPHREDVEVNMDELDDGIDDSSLDGMDL